MEEEVAARHTANPVDEGDRAHYLSQRLSEEVDLVSVATHARKPSVRPTAHIARSRSINISGIKPVATDKWLHYDQVGSVMLATNASAAVADTRHADAFGNEMSSWSAGAWTDSLAERTGWGHNTKELDGDTGLVYMYQRWYLPEAGIFVSKALFHRQYEHPYGFADSRPTSIHDSQGRITPAGAINYCRDAWKDASKPPGACRTGAKFACDFMQRCLDELGAGITVNHKMGRFHDECEVRAGYYKCTFDRICLGNIKCWDRYFCQWDIFRW